VKSHPKIKIASGQANLAQAYTTAWDPVRNDPRFQKLCEEKRIDS